MLGPRTDGATARLWTLELVKLPTTLAAAPFVQEQLWNNTMYEFLANAIYSV